MSGKSITKGLMCYNKAQHKPLEDISQYYSAKYSDAVKEQYEIRYFESGFKFQASAIVTSLDPGELVMSNWGLIPWWTKTPEQAKEMRTRTLNCISEEMSSKPSYRDAVKAGQRCLIPCTGFFEWQWRDNGKLKVPHFIRLKDSELFSLAGLYSTWNDKRINEVYHTYTILTTKANPLMEEIHNSKKRMPVIIPREYEKDWLNNKLEQGTVNALCKPIEETTMEAWTVSKMLTDRKIKDKNVPSVQDTYEWNA